LNKAINNGTAQRCSLKKYALVTIALWSLVIALSIYVNHQLNTKHLLDIGKTIARASFEKDILYRRWNAAQGGVYARQSETTAPNPHLHIAERDITTPLGKQLTMINPAYMTRQAHEIGRLTNGIQGHITSLNPIRQANKADVWEKQALEQFELGVAEVSSFAMLHGKKYLRLMRPLITEKGCLKCHQQQGYVLGQIRGGISQSVPMSLLSTTMAGNLTTIWVKHLILWFIGSVFIYFTYCALSRKTLALAEANKKLEVLALTDALTNLSNRRHAMQILQLLWDESIEHNTALACMMIDADNFKQINDTYGHDSGDIVLRELANKLHDTVRTDDIVCRLGGDEFFIICPHTDKDGAKHIANLVLDNVLAMTVKTGDGAWRGSISIGLAIKTDLIHDIDQLIKIADLGVYAAKEAGKGCVRVAND
jgi:diguanylate cyclase (GGDEF)-like protein